MDLFKHGVILFFETTHVSVLYQPYYLKGRTGLDTAVNYFILVKCDFLVIPCVRQLFSC